MNKCKKIYQQDYYLKKKYNSVSLKEISNLNLIPDIQKTTNTTPIPPRTVDNLDIWFNVIKKCMREGYTYKISEEDRIFFWQELSKRINLSTAVGNNTKAIQREKEKEKSL